MSANGLDSTEMAVLADTLARILRSSELVRGPQPIDRVVWGRLHALGMTRLTGTEEHGGAGAGWTESAVLLRALGEYAARVPVAEHDLLAEWLLESGDCPRQGDGPEYIRTAAIAAPDGVASDVPWARYADSVVLLWPVGDSWRMADIAHGRFTVHDGANIACEPRDHIRVDVAAIGGVEVSADIVTRFRYRGALARAQMACGAMSRVIDMVVDHVTVREQFGRPLVKFQAIQHMAADMAAEATLAQAAVDAAVARADACGFADSGSRFVIAAARSCVGHAAATVVRGAHQCLGAIGFTEEHDLHVFTNRLLAWRGEYGSVRFWDLQVATAAAAAGERGLWPLISASPSGTGRT
ncbi:acyl-CoA dehydrogenase family protein [Nocardia brevicatena]|uniref:acyl-CoA dehydrogenase family protein n=1 Tax=Nocardia brevicatena TaxID=37327 RepID=UPI0002DD1494|nr:acyl-CoA dehydrogenase family protein [Nocardia brevicatena]